MFSKYAFYLKAGILISQRPKYRIHKAVKIFPNIVNEAEKPVSLAKLLRFWQPLLYGLTQEFLNT